jgi:hypothetical protein
MNLFNSHEVADPHTISTISPRQAAQEFQKCSNAGMKRDLGVSNHGNSSMKTIFLPVGREERSFLSSSNAEIHPRSTGQVT